MEYTESDDFEWDEDNVEHISRHEVSVEEAIDAFADPRAAQFRATTVRGEKRWSFVGQTAAGRTLFVVYTRRSGLVRVVTARGASLREAAFYRRHRGKR